MGKQLVNYQIEDTKGLIRCRKSKDGQQKNGQAMIYKTLHIKLMIEQRESHLKPV
jgi:hypothetical protein